MRRAVLLAALALAAAPAVAEDRFSCRMAGDLVATEARFGPERCAFDGARGATQATGGPWVCHISTPQLRIVTVSPDLGVTWEDTDADRIRRGTCEAG